jgi:hypothetical protein
MSSRAGTSALNVVGVEFSRRPVSKREVLHKTSEHMGHIRVSKRGEPGISVNEFDGLADSSAHWE